MARNVVYHMSEAYNIGYDDGWKDAVEKACEEIWKYVEQCTSFLVENYEEGNTDEGDDVFRYDKMAEDIIKAVKKAMEGKE